MSALGIGLAWAAMAMAAFMALSAGALARTLHDLEATPGNTDTAGARSDAALDHGHASFLMAERREELMEPALLTASARQAGAHWPPRFSQTTALRSSPSVAYMTASAGRPGPIHLS